LPNYIRISGIGGFFGPTKMRPAISAEASSIEPKRINLRDRIRLLSTLECFICFTPDLSAIHGLFIPIKAPLSFAFFAPWREIHE
jgi:hypothetical protein